MANRRRSTRRRRRAPIRRAVRRPTPANETTDKVPTTRKGPKPVVAPGRRVMSLPYLRRDLAIGLGLGLGLTLVVVAVGLAVA